jgi:hypothetical protein
MHQKILAFISLCIICLISFSSNSLADTFSKPGIGVKVTLFNGLFGKTAIGSISGIYKSTSNIEGILFAAPLPIPEPLASDIDSFNFVDTKGIERCYGSTSMSSGGVNVWEIKGAVPGYRCSTIGKTYSFNFGR